MPPSLLDRTLSHLRRTRSFQKHGFGPEPVPPESGVTPQVTLSPWYQQIVANPSGVGGGEGPI